MSKAGMDELLEVLCLCCVASCNSSIIFNTTSKETNSVQQPLTLDSIINKNSVFSVTFSIEIVIFFF